MEEAPRWVDVFPDGLLPLEQESDNPFLLRPPRGATWRRTNSDPPQFFIANEFNAIAAANVRRDDLDELFPGHAELFDSVVSKVLGAANSGYMNDYEALPQEQVSALRLLMQTSKELCSWADDAVEYLIQSGCYTEAAEEAADLQELAAPKRASVDGGDQSASKKRGRPLYADQEFDLFSEGGKAPVGAGKLPL